MNNITYDANGNILSLNRYKNTQSGSNRMDELTYHYKANKNQLDRVTDAYTGTTNVADIKTQNTGNYTYNKIGQLTHNAKENVAYVYNAAGLVTEVQKNNVPLVKFFYNDKGHRVRKEVYNTSGTLTATDYYIRDAAGNTLAIYKNTTLKEVPIYGAGRLGVYYTPSLGESEGAFRYQLTDHLGNVRAVIARATTTPSTTRDYYPGGMAMPGRQVIGSEQYRYAYQGQEKDPKTGKEAFELRLWDSRIARWLSPDPYNQFYSPYLGMGNDPINNIDPDGGKTKGPDDDYKLNADGTFTLIAETDFADRVFNDAGDFVQLEYDGQIADMKSISVPGRNDFKYISFSNDNISTKAFEFFAQNSNVEWGQVLYDKNSSYVTTNNSSLYLNSLAESLLSRGYIVRESTHSHPIFGSDFPSGFTPNGKLSAIKTPGQENYGDQGNVSRLYSNEDFGSKAKGIIFKVYSAKNDSYVQYNNKGAHKVIHIPKTVGIKF